MAAVAKKTRGRSGCLNCRRRRKKCDETKPSCSKCNFRGEKCEWDSGITFRCSGLDFGHTSVTQSHTAKSQPRSEFQIIKTPSGPSNLSASSKGYQSAIGMTQIPASSQQQPRDVGTENQVTLESDHSRLNSSLNRERAVQFSHVMDDIPSTNSLLPSEYGRLGSVSYSSPEASVNRIYTERESQMGHPVIASQTISDSSPVVGAIDPNLQLTHDAQRATIFHSNGDTFPEIATADLEALDYLISTPTNFDLFLSSTHGDNMAEASNQNLEAVPLEPIMVESPETDATYYPDPTYKELHSVLHNHMIETARATILTRQTTPEPPPQDSIANSKYLTPSLVPERIISKGAAPTIKPVDRVITRRELELWQNYLEEVAVWLDMFDVERNFQLKIPMMAKTADHLHYSILSLSARQMERTHADKPYTESLTLYQKAIELIVLELHTLDTSVIASCVLLCVLEMMTSSPRAWGRHLDGCAMLLQAAGINGTVGGVRQAMFWCFARMDVWGGFLSDSRTRIPTSRWFMPSGSMSSAVSRFKTGSMGFDSYANYAVFLCASVVNVLSNRGSNRSQENSSDINHSYSARWKALFDLLEDWYSSRPEEMQPLIAVPTVLEDHQHPFPIILYGNSPAINGNQLYHASSLLMLQEKPKEMRLGKSHKSIHWHARQICGIATSNRIHGPWINALQPLWIAGKAMSHPIEHRVILETLASIEKETGWATSWRAEDLREYWGELDD